MILHATRDHFTPTTTLGRLFIAYDGPTAYAAGCWRPGDGPREPLLFGYTAEDEDRGLDSADPKTWARKVKAETAIPIGKYQIRITHSPKYKRLMMRVTGVPAFDGVLIHQGNTEAHTAGCVLPGLYRDEAAGKVTDSAKATAWLFSRVSECEARGEAVWLSIGRDPSAWAGFLAAGGADGAGRAA
jgi:hypothetical protein